eukprot:1161677-Pelagomonas_calceolata.AAC.19
MEGMRIKFHQGYKLFSFVSELMDIMLAGEDQSQADQPNSLAEGPPVIQSHPTVILYDACGNSAMLMKIDGWCRGYMAPQP